MRKPRIFIASSVESLDVADAINVNLNHQAEVTVWKNGFKLSADTIDSLMEKARTVDFAIFIFTPDDVATIRSKEELIVRDNVLYELGIFTGTLGKDRCFVVKPREIDLHLPTDLLGLTPTDFDGERSDGDLVSAVNYPCVKIKQPIAELGLFIQDKDIKLERRRTLGYDYELGDIEHTLLAKILEEYAGEPDGVSVWSILNGISEFNTGAIALASIKQERTGFLDKGIASDMNHEFYTYAITADGIDYLLENEHLIKKNLKLANHSRLLDRMHHRKTLIILMTTYHFEKQMPNKAINYGLA